MKKRTFSLLLLTTFLCLGCNKTVDLGEPLTDNEKMDFLRTVNDNMSLIPDGWYKLTYKEYGVKTEFTFEIKNISFDGNKWEYNIVNMLGKATKTSDNETTNYFYYFKDNLYYEVRYNNDKTDFHARYHENPKQIKFYDSLFSPIDLFDPNYDSHLVKNTFYNIERESTDPVNVLSYDHRIEITYSKDFKKIVKGVQSNIFLISFFNPEMWNVKQETTIKPCRPIEINFTIDDRATSSGSDGYPFISYR